MILSWKEAILRRDDVKIDVAAILNDTTGYLITIIKLKSSTNKKMNEKNNLFNP